MKISIIVPTYNNFNFLKFFISSVKNNSYYDHEIIVHINDGTDGTLDYIKQNKILYTFSKNNVGICDAVNKAYFDQVIQSLQSQIDALETQLNNGNAAEIPTEGLVAYYPFNGNANDESDNGNNGSVNRAVLSNSL